MRNIKGVIQKPSFLFTKMQDIKGYGMIAVDTQGTMSVEYITSSMRMENKYDK